MEYTPRYPQPFTLTEALNLDVAVINEEIARLQNSLKHLEETQNILESSLKDEEDIELRKAFEENQAVIGSQQERISILKMALEEKGIISGSHYDMQAPSQLATTNNTTANDESGVYL